MTTFVNIHCVSLVSYWGRYVRFMPQSWMAFAQKDLLEAQPCGVGLSLHIARHVLGAQVVD